MPIELISFNYDLINNEHLIKWVLGSQINVDHFLLEVSKDGHAFEVLDTVAGAGTISQPKSYQFLHQELTPGIYTYKLFTVSTEGIKWELGTIEIINYANNLHPNPAQSKLNFHFNQSELSNVVLQIYDLNGKRLALSESQIESNYYGFSIDVSTLPNGIYIAKIQADELERIEKFVVKK